MVSAVEGVAAAAGGDGGAGQDVEGVPVTLRVETTAYISGRQLGRGTLTISHELLSWNEDSKNVGFSLLYPNISLHAIRREPIPSLYMMIDHKLELPEGLSLPEDPIGERDSGGESDCEDAEQPITELMFAPTDQDLLQKLFVTMSECQALHPDPNDDFSDEEEDDDIYEDASGVMEDEPMENDEGRPAENNMEDQQLESNNGHTPNNGDMDCDPDQFADD